MLKMEDSGIDSDCKSNGIAANSVDFERSRSIMNNSPTGDHPDCSVKFSGGYDSLKKQRSISEESSNSSGSPSTKLLSSHQLQKRLERQLLQAKKIRQKEQSIMGDNVPKKHLISHSRLKVPKTSQVPVVTKADSHPLVSWESESEDEEFNLLSNKSTRDITQQLLKDGYNLDLTPDDEDLDLIPPKPFEQRCMCCNPNNMCVIL